MNDINSVDIVSQYLQDEGCSCLCCSKSMRSPCEDGFCQLSELFTGCKDYKEAVTECQPAYMYERLSEDNCSKCIPWLFNDECPLPFNDGIHVVVSPKYYDAPCRVGR